MRFNLRRSWDHVVQHRVLGQVRDRLSGDRLSYNG